MPPTPAPPSAPLALVCGDDEFAVKQRAKQLFQQWSQELGGMDHEIIDATAGNSDDVMRILGKLREAMQTLPFFGGGKAIWLRDVNFLGDDRTAESKLVTESLGELAQELKTFRWDNVRLLISAGKVDKRKVFYKTCEKNGNVEAFVGLSADDRNWADQAETLALREMKSRQKDISDEALAKLVAYTGPNARQLVSEIEKLTLFVGDQPEIGTAEVDAIVTRNKQARAFALGDALGDRDLPKLLKALDDELWEMQFDKQKSEIGLLYGLITKVRTMLSLQEMMKAGWIKPDGDYTRFKSQLERVPTDALPKDRRLNPLAMNPYVLFKAVAQAKNYSSEELVRAMDLLLRCNRRLVQSGLDESLVLQQTLTEIVTRSVTRSTTPTRR